MQRLFVHVAFSNVMPFPLTLIVLSPPVQILIMKWKPILIHSDLFPIPNYYNSDLTLNPVFVKTAFVLFFIYVYTTLRVGCFCNIENVEYE